MSTIQDHSAMKFMYLSLMKRPYLTLAVLSLLMVAEMGLAFGNFLPIEYDLPVGWLLFLTILAWIGTVGLIGVSAPVVRSTMSYMHSVLMKRPYLILAMLSLAIITEITLAFLGIWHFEYQWLLGCLLFITILIWMSIACLAGVATPIGRSVMKYAYPILMASPLVVLAVIWLVIFGQSHPNSPLLYIAMLWLATTVIIGTVSPADTYEKALAILVVFPLMFLTWIGLFSFAGLMFNYGFTLSLGWLAFAITFLPHALRTRSTLATIAGKPRIHSMYIAAAITAIGKSTGFIVLATGMILAIPFLYGVFFFIAPVALPAILFAVPGTALFGIMKHPYRNIAMAAIGLWVMLVTVGALWMILIDDGLDAFTDEEITAAQSVLDTSRCIYAKSPLPSNYAPATYRVVKDNDGFRVLGYTYWGLPERVCSH